MAYEAERTGGEPVFDTDRAWERFKKSAARVPVPAVWSQEDNGRRGYEKTNDTRRDGNRMDLENDGRAQMKQSEIFQATRGPSMVAAGGTWRTETPAKRRLRRWTVGVAAAAMAVGLIATPLGDRALAQVMDTFRVQHLVGVGLSADDLATISSLLERGSPDGDRSFSLAQYGSLNQSGGGESRTVTWEEAETLLGAPLLRLENASAPSYQPATTLTFRLNVKAVNRLLTRLGSTTTLPMEADGKAIRLQIPDGIVSEGSLSGKPVALREFGKPALTVEGGIDAATVREAVLGLPVLPENLRTQLAAIGDWTRTLPVPGRDGTATNLRLGGYDAVLTVRGNHRFLFWLDGDRMGLLSGDLKDFPSESSFRSAAEALIQP